MADYNGRVLTNYFRVEDEQALRSLLNRCAANGKIEVYQKMINGVAHFSFRCMGEIYGVSDSEDDEGDYGEFIVCLQSLLPKGEALILLEAGGEKLNYLRGVALVLTKYSSETIDIKLEALQSARDQLDNPVYDTRMDY